MSTKNRTNVDWMEIGALPPNDADAFAYAVKSVDAVSKSTDDPTPNMEGIALKALKSCPSWPLTAQLRAAVNAGFKGHIGQTAVLVDDQGVLHILYGVSMPKNQGWRPWDQYDEVLTGRGFAYAVRTARKAGVKHLCCLSGTAGLLSYYGLSANYEFDPILGQPQKEDGDSARSGKPLDKITIYMSEADMVVKAGFARNLGRDWMNESFNNCSTIYMAENAMEAFVEAANGSEHRADVHDGTWMDAQGFDLTLTVGRASNQQRNPPLVVVLEWIGRPDAPSETDYCLVGKGVVHDKGGLNLKSDSGDMHMDKGGACTVLATMCALARLKMRQNVRCIVFLVENAIGPDCSTTGDVVYSRMLGKKIRISNTDAEGRLGLAECIAWAKKTWDPKVGIDVATLTGLQAAFTPGGSTVFATNMDLGTSFMKKAAYVGDRVTIGWPDYTCFKDLEDNAGPGADMGTIGTRKFGTISAGGTVVGAEFVLQFVAHNTRWLHIDMAGAMDRGKDDGEFSQGADVPNVTSLIHWLGSANINE